MFFLQICWFFLAYVLDEPKKKPKNIRKSNLRKLKKKEIANFFQVVRVIYVRRVRPT